MNENKEKTAGNLANSVVEGYDYSVAVRMSGRAGAFRCPGGRTDHKLYGGNLAAGQTEERAGM